MADHRVRPEEMRRRRKRKMWNQKKLADAAGMSLGQISRIEQGLHNPHLSSVEKIAAALEVEPDEILDWNDIPEESGQHEENLTKLDIQRGKIDAQAEKEREELRKRDSGGANRSENRT